MSKQLVGRITAPKLLTARIDKGTGMGELPSAVGLSEFPMPAYSANGIDLTSVQTAIAEKSGVEKPVFPEGWIGAVEGIEKPPEVFYTPLSGVMYHRVMDFRGSSSAIAVSAYKNAAMLEEFYAPEIACDKVAQFGQEAFSGCTALKIVYLPKVTYCMHYNFRTCTALQKVQLGSVRYPVTAMTTLVFSGCSQADLEVTIYVDATRMDDIPTQVKSVAPFGATNATIIYRNSTTGEVITE